MQLTKDLKERYYAINKSLEKYKRKIREIKDSLNERKPLNLN
jgi:hypothetical protein